MLSDPKMKWVFLKISLKKELNELSKNLQQYFINNWYLAELTAHAAVILSLF